MLHRLMSEIQPMLACECNSILCTLELMGDWAVSGACQTIYVVSVCTNPWLCHCDLKS